MKKITTRHSASNIDGRLSCPFRFNHADYIESTYMAKGTKGHEELEAILNDDIIEGRKQISKMYPKVDFISNIKGHGIELKHEIKINKNEVIVGRIDYYEYNDKILHIIDWKTGYKISNSDTQPLVYALLLYDKGLWRQGMKCIVDIAYINKNYTKSFVYTDIEEILEDLENKIELAKKYEERDTRIPNDYCIYCQYRMKCIVAPDVEDYPDDIIEADRLLQLSTSYIKQLKEHIKLLSEKLMDDNNGELPDNIKYKETTTERVIKKSDAIDLLIENGVDIQSLPHDISITFLRKHKQYYKLLKQNGFISASITRKITVDES